MDKQVIETFVFQVLFIAAGASLIAAGVLPKDAPAEKVSALILGVVLVAMVIVRSRA